MNKKISTLFWILFFIVFTAIYGYRFVVEGMFSDGIVYSSISRNMAIGKGTFWAPFFSTSFWSEYNKGVVFYEHPPLIFYIQSMFFKVFGEHHYVEKFYSFCVFLMTVLLLSKTWKLYLPEKLASKGMEWLPPLLYISMMEVEWTTPNNMLENTMGVFCILSFYLAGFALVKNKNQYLFMALAGLALVAAFLAKGPVGLYPLVTPIVFGIFIDWKNIWRYIKLQSMLLATVIVCFAGLFTYPASKNFLTTYLSQQVLKAFEGKREGVGVDLTAKLKFFIGFYEQFHLIFPVLIVFGLIYYLVKKLKKDFIQEDLKPYLKYSGLFISLGLAGSFPIALSSKQNFYYMVPALGFFGLGLSVLFFYFGKGIFGTLKMSDKTFKICLITGIFLLIGVSGYSLTFYGQVRSYEQDVIKDVKKMTLQMPKDMKLAACSSLMTDFNTHAYLQRYMRIELTSVLEESEYYISEANCANELNPELLNSKYIQLQLGTERYSIYKKK